MKITVKPTEVRKYLSESGWRLQHTFSVNCDRLRINSIETDALVHARGRRDLGGAEQRRHLPHKVLGRLRRGDIGVHKDASL